MGLWVRAGTVGVCLLLAACQGKRDGETPRAADTAGPATAAQTTGAAAVDEPPLPGAGGIDEALAVLRAYNDRAAKELAFIDQQEARIKAAATRAAEAARGAEGASESQRQALTQRVTAARHEADQARSVLIDGQARLQKDIDEQVAAAEAAMGTCGSDERLAAYASCVALNTEHDLLLKNIDALTARYQATDVAYGVERAKLEEASASVALAALR